MKSVIKKDSGKKGKSLAIFCGVHGNEKVGILTVQQAIKNIKINRGLVYFVFANPQAIRQNKRLVEKNLNRCFLPDINGHAYEEKRARKLMRVLDSVDALLDLHSSNSTETIPFAITDNGLDIVRNMNFKIVATGFDNLEPGATDGYMNHQDKIGICLECGYSGDPKKNFDLAYNSIKQFLQYFKVIKQLVPNSRLKQKTLHVDQVQKVGSRDFKLTRTFADFELLEKGVVLAQDKTRQYITDRQRVILFGRPGKSVGSEAYILGTWKK